MFSPSSRLAWGACQAWSKLNDTPAFGLPSVFSSRALRRRRAGTPSAVLSVLDLPKKTSNCEAGRFHEFLYPHGRGPLNAGDHRAAVDAGLDWAFCDTDSM